MFNKPEDMACGNDEQRVPIGCNVELTRGRLRGMTGVLIGYSRGLNGLIRLDGVQLGVVLVIDPASMREHSPEVADRGPTTAKMPPHPADQDFTAG